MHPKNVHFSQLVTHCAAIIFAVNISEQEETYSTPLSLRFKEKNFTNQVIPVWNSLPNHVFCAGTINTFKNCLDKFSSDQEVLYYDYNTDCHSIGNCSSP